tara:strand:+ start:2760 stop:3965 length:1206 start_codon:yes stop_codon:yes gene_type:complete
MLQNNLILFVEINYSKYIFVTGRFDGNHNFEVIEKIIVPNTKDTNDYLLLNIDQAQDIIKKNVQLLEDKLNCIYKEVIVILDNFEYTSINISGSKRLNGSQILKENISYILNFLKLEIIENEKEKSILQIFNSRSILDGKRVENLPIGLFGDFYSHELTFFLIKNNDLKNIKKIFNKNNLYINKILTKDFIEGTQIINKNKNSETFFKIKIYKDSSSISYFENASFKFINHFKFGSNIILSDICKVCSIEKRLIENILSDTIFKNENIDESDFLEEKYFVKGNYKKIKKSLIIEIVNARIEEMINIIFEKNINITSLKKKIDDIVYLNLEDRSISSNFGKNFYNYFIERNNLKISFIDNFSIEDLIICASRLSTFGWKKEAIPITQTKNSLITRIFKSIFE